jgi:RalA-binding protein 1
MPPQDPRNLSARLAGSDMAPSASMPANLDAIARGSLAEPEKRSTSAQGHHNEVRTPSKLQAASDRRRPSGQADRSASPEKERERHRQDSATKLVASNVSGPMNAQPLPSGYEFKKAERQKKTKSSFWNFGARGEFSFAFFASSNCLLTFLL